MDARGDLLLPHRRHADAQGRHTSLSKVYRVIDRFSKDIDPTYDIRALVPDQPEFDATLETCAAIQDEVNRLA
ncbi:nucleotidyl transferase AbiEii/AbiGii toxin family protein [Thioalkalicoccus limnaeus]|uniref:Nucleotidyl transferase AbiEii/AbiGii toxin family protein n=1 Tax=Thioalkalicoccus limnaeus TaxID=120681 RepID=A0ABV4BCM7_9GAMM